MSVFSDPVSLSIAPLALGLLVAAAGAVAAVIGKGKQGEGCETLKDWERDEKNVSRAEMFEAVESADLAPGRVLFSDGSPVTEGTIQIAWQSDGPWGEPGCDPARMELRSLSLAEAPVNTKPLNIDLEHMLSPEAWGPEHHRSEILLQDDDLASVQPMGRIATRVVGLSIVLTSSPIYKRRSWMTVQVESGGQVWTTENFGSDVSLNKWGTSFVPGPQGPMVIKVDQRQEAKAPPTAIYGALSVYDGPAIRGPDALVLLRPDENGSALLSLFGAVDRALVLYPKNADVAFEGQDWFTPLKVTEALANPELIQIAGDSNPGNPIRGIDVILWLLLEWAAKYRAPSDEPVPGYLDYLNMIGNRDELRWLQLRAAKPGFSNLLDRHYYQAQEIVDDNFDDPFG